MATPKKKHLIELMIEAGVKWPDGEEYAAQDKDSWLALYASKPYMESGKVTWSSDGGYVANSLKKLDSLCRNWHQTIVTREQYAEAVAAANASGKTNQVRESEDVPASQPAAQLYSGVAGVMPSETIESMLAEIKAKREEHDALAAKADALALEIASVEQQVNDKLKEYGFAMSPVAAPSEPEQPVITDWRDLRVGDVIWWEGDSRIDSGEYTVERIETADYKGYCTIFLSVKEWVDVSCEEWHFIRRP